MPATSPAKSPRPEPLADALADVLTFVWNKRQARESAATVRPLPPAAPPTKGIRPKPRGHP